MLGKDIKNRRILAVMFLGLSSGLPLALTGSTLQAWFTQSGVNIYAIGALSLLGLPYVWKFLWAPVMDRFIPPLFGRRRGWVCLTQIILCVTLFVISGMQPSKEGTLIGFLALFIAFVSASQDIAVDAYRTDILSAPERGLGAAVFTFGFRIAMLLSGGLALIMADYIGWQLTYQLMAVLIGCTILVTVTAPEVTEVTPPKSFVAAIVDPFINLLGREKIILILLFILLYKLGDALALSLMSNFLLRGLGFSLTEVGIAFKVGGLIATIVGAFLGGIFLIRIPLTQALLWFGLLQAFSNLMFVFLAMMGPNLYFMFASIFIEQFCSGLSTAAFVAFLMSLCHARFSATQYACLSALTACGRVFAGPVAAYVVDGWGWIMLYGWAFILSFPGLIVLYLLRLNERVYNEEVVVKT